ncbi:MAG: hypothetical protein KatS3mg105_5056 [Gemmatales bacterium]|nr:MAG: hypothetical protein KatS3mg105_5056 [Gemmatales bacterium]
MIPKQSNHRMADWARGPHLRALKEAGGTIHAYPRMIHAKTAVFDSSIALVGSANMDERSLLLNYELMLAIYSATGIATVADWINSQVEECEAWEPRHGRTRAMAEAFAETMSPLL